LEPRVNALQDECAKLSGTQVIEEAVKNLNLDDNMKENIINCIQVAKAREPNGRRYTQKWLYECILLKIKNSGTYEHIIRHHLMPLPCISTIQRYIRKLKPAYGFQEGVFRILKEKSGGINNMEKEGINLG